MSTSMPTMSRLGPALILLLAGCGGGGHDDDNRIEALDVTFTYLEPSSGLFSEFKANPIIDGLEGNDPNCQLQSGRLPEGLELNSRDCMIHGTPTEAGNFSYTLRLTVANFDGHLDKTVALDIRQPNFSYEDGDTMVWGEPFAAAGPIWWDSNFSEGTTIAYSKGDGEWPEGLNVDPATGKISGLPQPTVNAGTVSVVANVEYDGHAVEVVRDFRFVAAPAKVTYPAEQVDIGNNMTATPTLPTALRDGSYAMSYAIVAASDCEALGSLAIVPETGIVTGHMDSAIGACIFTVGWKAQKGAIEVGGSATLNVTN